MCAMVRRDTEGDGDPKGEPKRKALLSRPVVSLALAMLVSAVGFQLLISVVPLYAVEVGGGTGGAGSATAAFMLTTVLTQVSMPRLLGRFGYRRGRVGGAAFFCRSPPPPPP